MAQKANMELVENLRPFIAKMIQRSLLAYEKSRVAGTNITVDEAGQISLAPYVEIERVLRISNQASFELWDNETGIFRQLRISNIDGSPFLEFADIIDSDGYETQGGGGETSAGLTAGNNIDVDASGKVSLSQYVEIEKGLRVGSEAVFEMWDSGSQQYRQIRITSIDGAPYLEFVDPSDWEGL